ncbi:hypothetical protein Mal33_50510 [Rosistilla oblonga]|uniref:Uncharacterized protein n=1 Tax=Rosistilla oblonga TaxID=2527990 RepID=A0A518J106_9BACT|nr:hypothetical protein Mal33_50510 [Rosistilla oblonga]
MAAQGDLATTKRGHRHSGASVGYLISSVSSPIRTSTRSIDSIASIRSSQIESLIERNYVSNRREQVSVDIEQKNRKASKRSNRSLPGYRKRSSDRTQIVYLRPRSKVKSVVWPVPFSSMNRSGKRLGAIFRESKRRRRSRNQTATSSGRRSGCSRSGRFCSNNVCDNRVAAVDLPFVNALSATPRSSLGYPPTSFSNN